MEKKVVYRVNTRSGWELQPVLFEKLKDALDYKQALIEEYNELSAEQKARLNVLSGGLYQITIETWDLR